MSRLNEWTVDDMRDARTRRQHYNAGHRPGDCDERCEPRYEPEADYLDRLGRMYACPACGTTHAPVDERD